MSSLPNSMENFSPDVIKLLRTMKGYYEKKLEALEADLTAARSEAHLLAANLRALQDQHAAALQALQASRTDEAAPTAMVSPPPHHWMESGETATEGATALSADLSQALQALREQIRQLADSVPDSAGDPASVSPDHLPRDAAHLRAALHHFQHDLPSLSASKAASAPLSPARPGKPGILPVEPPSLGGVIADIQDNFTPAPQESAAAQPRLAASPTPMPLSRPWHWAITRWLQSR